MGSGAGEWRRRRSCELSWSEEEAAPCRHVQEFGLDLKSNGRLFREGLFKGACRQDPGRETSGSLGCSGSLNAVLVEETDVNLGSGEKPAGRDGG